MASTSQIVNPVPAATTGNSPFAGAQHFDGPICEPPPGAITVPEFSAIARLPYFSFRNGVPSQASSLLIKETIPSAYYWRPILNLPASRAKEHAGAFVKTAYLGLWDNKPASLPDNKVLKAAVLIGIARAVVTTLYEINVSDLIPDETGGAILTATHIGGGKYTFTQVADLSANILAHINDPIDFDQATNDAIPSIHMSAIGLPALQGWSLMMTGHNYLSDPGSQSRKGYAVVERQFWRAKNVTSWWNDDLDLCTDALWHKACHPINLKAKYRYATSDSVKEMVVTAGAGSAACRLPAIENELRAANRLLVLFQKVHSMYESYGGNLDYSVLSYAVELAKSYPHDPSMPPTPVTRAHGTPPWIVDRTSAIRFLSKVMAANADVSAHAFGFYTAMTEQSALMGTAATIDTIKTSFSLTKLRNQSTAAYTAGYQAYADYSAFKARQRRQAGEYQPIRLSVTHNDMETVH